MVDENTLKESAQILYGCNTDFMWLQRAMNPFLNYRDGICKLSVGECTVHEAGGLRRLHERERGNSGNYWSQHEDCDSELLSSFLQYLDIQYYGLKVYITIYTVHLLSQLDSYWCFYWNTSATERHGVAKVSKSTAAACTLYSQWHSSRWYIMYCGSCETTGTGVEQNLSLKYNNSLSVREIMRETAT